MGLLHDIEGRDFAVHVRVRVDQCWGNGNL